MIHYEGGNGFGYKFDHSIVFVPSKSVFHDDSESVITIVTNTSLASNLKLNERVALIKSRSLKPSGGAFL